MSGDGKLLDKAEKAVDLRRSMLYLSRELENLVDMGNPDVANVVRRLQLASTKGVQDAVFQLESIKNRLAEDDR